MELYPKSFYTRAHDEQAVSLREDNEKQKQIQLDGMFVPLRLNSIPLTQFSQINVTRYKGDYLAINEFGFRRI